MRTLISHIEEVVTEASLLNMYLAVLESFAISRMDGNGLL